MITGKKLAALWRRTEPRSAKRDELRGYVRGQLYPRPILYALLALFGVSEMLSVDWFGLLLLNSDGVVRQMISFNALHVTVVVLGGVAITSVTSGRTTSVSTSTLPRRTASSPWPSCSPSHSVAPALWQVSLRRTATA